MKNENETDKQELYNMLKKLDKHVISMITWVSSIDYIEREVRDSGMDQELADDLKAMQVRLIGEVGVRVAMLLA